MAVIVQYMVRLCSSFTQIFDQLSRWH